MESDVEGNEPNCSFYQASKLFEYIIGRNSSLGDRRVTDKIFFREPEFGFERMDLVAQFVQSDSFLFQ